MRLDGLPRELFLRLTGFLTGFDLASVSCISRHVHSQLAGVSADVWATRQFALLPSSATAVDWKRCYLTSASLRFPGRRNPREYPEAACVELPPLTRDDWAAESFSFDVWFALLPSHDNASVGGILLGAQSEDVFDEWWPDMHQPFLHIDSAGTLFCSVVDEKEPIATHMELERWYHVALSFENHGYEDTSSVQRVFVNGEMVRETRGWLHREWDELHYVQLGTGCITDDTPGTPGQGFSGWCEFNGIVDECRLWRGVLSDEDVKQLVRTGDEARIHIERYWSMKESLAVEDVHTPLAVVRCTRPIETWCVDVRHM